MNDEEGSIIRALLELTRYYAANGDKDAELFEAFLRDAAEVMSNTNEGAIPYRDLDLYFGLLQDAPKGMSAMTEDDLRAYGDKMLEPEPPNGDV